MLLIQYIPVLIIEVHTHKLLLALSSNGAWTKEPDPTCMWRVISSYSNDRKVTQGLKKFPFIFRKTKNMLMGLELFSDIIMKCHPVPIISRS
jgi:hypothetical protein